MLFPEAETYTSQDGNQVERDGGGAGNLARLTVFLRKTWASVGVGLTDR